MDRIRTLVALVTAALLAAPAAGAQTDYYNTDRGRPVRVEDAYVAERYAFELKLAPVRLERAGGGAYRWSVEPELAYGILPRTQVEVGLPLEYAEAGAAHRSGIAGLDLSIMHTLNAETEGVPALGVRADLLAPVGALAPARWYPTVTAMATRTMRWGRVHLNGGVTAGTTSADPAAGDLSRWLVGVAVDRTFPLSATLVTAELFGRRPLADGEAVEYTAGTGVRHQVTTKVALDAGVGRRLTGGDAGWYVTFGSAYAFSVRALMPGGR